MKTILRKELGYTLSVHKISKTCTKFIMSVHKTGFSCTEDLEKRLFELEKSYGIKYLPTDFKKEGGYLRSIELSKQYDLYRQNYCGCSFSRDKLR